MQDKPDFEAISIEEESATSSMAPLPQSYSGAITPESEPQVAKSSMNDTSTSVSDDTESEIVVATQVEEESSQLEPSQREPSQLEPSQREPSQLEPSQLEPSQLEPSQLEPSQLEPSQLEPSQLEPSQLEPSQLEPEAESSASTDQQLQPQRTTTEIGKIFDIKVLDGSKCLGLEISQAADRSSLSLCQSTYIEAKVKHLGIDVTGKGPSRSASGQP